MAKKKAYNLGEEIAKAAEKAKKTVEENAEKNASTIKYSGRTTPRGNKIGVGESEREKILNKYGINDYDKKESNRIRLEFGSGPISSGVSSNSNKKTTNLPYMKAVKPLDVMADVKKTAENPVTPYSRIGKNYSETTNKAYENIIDNDDNVRRKEFFADIKRLFGSYGEYTDVYTNEATRGSEYLEEKYEIAEKYSPEEIQSYLAYLYTELPKYDQARKEKLYSKEDIEDFYKEKREEWAFLGRLGDDNPYIDRSKKWDREETLKAMVPTLEVMMETAPVVEERAQQRDNAIVKYGTMVKNLEAKGYNDTYDTNKSDIPSVNGTFALSLIYHAINGKNSSGSTDTREAHTGGGNVEHMMTSGEKTIFNTLINAGKYEDAYEFYMDIQPDLEVRAREWEVEKEKLYAQEHPWIAGFKTAVTNEFYEPAAFVDDVMDMIVGDGINPFDATSRGITRGQTRRQVGSEVVAEKYGIVGSYAYDEAMVMSDMAADLITAKATGGITESMKIAKAVSYIKMFLSGYANTADSIKLRGGSDEQAILGGTLAGATEVLTESFAWDEILNGTSKGLKGFVKKFAKEIIPNAAEELTAEYLNIKSDALVMQNNSESQNRIGALVMSGMSGDEANKTVFKENVMRILKAGTLGGVVGGTMAGVSSTINGVAAKVNKADYLTTVTAEMIVDNPAAYNNIIYYGASIDNEEAKKVVEKMSSGLQITPAEAKNALSSVVKQSIEEDGGMVNIMGLISAMDGKPANYEMEAIDTAKAVMHFVQGKATATDKALISRSTGATTLLSAIEGESKAWNSIKQAAKAELRNNASEVQSEVLEGDSKYKADEHAVVRDGEVYDKDGNKVKISDKADIQNGIVVNGESKRMKERDSTGYGVAEKLGTDLKKPVKFVKGLYDADGEMLDGVETDSGIFINTEAKNPIKWAATHEFSHTMKKSAGEAWAKYQNFVINKLKKQSSDIKGLNEYEKRYLIKKRGYAEHEINEDIAADYIGELFDSVDELADFIKKDRGLAVKVRDIYYKALDKLGLLDEKKKAQQLWRDAYRKAVGNVEKGKVEGKFELDKNVETTKDLLAIHNLTESQLIEAINQKGIIMPSVAITNKGLSSFGDISVVFEKESIDPEENAANKMYGADAWTPQQTTLKLNPKFDDAKTRAFVNSIKNTIGENSDQIFDVDAEQFKETIENAKGSLFNAYAQDIGMQTAYALDSGLIDSIPTEFGRINQDALREELDSKLDKDVVWRKYKKWLGDISNDIITSYDKASRQDIMESMTRQPESAKRFNLTVDGELTVPAVEYSSVDEARKNKGRLSKTAEADAKKVGESFVEWANKLSAKSGVELNRIVKAVNTNFDNRYDIEGIRDNFNENGIPMTRTDANNLQRLYKDAVELPTLYFEAKPHRFVSTEEIAWVVLPNNANNSLKALLEENSITYKEYISGDEQSRIDVLNSLEGVKFSRRTAENKGENKKSISGTRLTEISSDMYKTMEEHFGTTNNFDVAGYLLTDGKMLDFSGKHWGAKNSDFRQVDHRDIQEVLEDDNNGRTAMVDMITHGNIRLMPENGGINLSQMPNEKQVSVLREYINHFRGEVIVDIDNADGKTIHSFEYGKRTSPSRIISDISNYFTEGIIPEKTKSDLAEFRYSRSGTRASEISDSLKEEFARLRSELENAHIQLNQAEGKGIDVKEVKRVAQDFRKQYGSKVRLSELHQDLTKLYNLMQSDKATADEVSQRVSEIADKVIDNATQTVTNDEYSELLDRIKNTKIMVPELERADFRDGYETFRKGNMGKITLANDGLDLDVFWDELTEEYPNLFDEDILGSEERLERILEVREEFAPREESVFTSDAEKEQARVKLKNDIMNAFYDIPEGESGTKYVFYDKRVADVEAGIDKEINKKKKELERVEEKTIKLKDKFNREKVTKNIDKTFGYLLSIKDNPTANRHIPEKIKKDVVGFVNRFVYDTKTVGKKDPKEVKVLVSVRLDNIGNAYKTILRKSWESDLNDSPLLDEKITEAFAEFMEEIPEDPSGNFKRFDDMTTKELAVVSDLLDGIHHAITQSNKLFAENIKETKSELSNAVEKDMEATRNKRRGNGEKWTYSKETGKVYKAYRAVEEFFSADLYKPWDMFHKVGGTMEKLYGNIRMKFDEHIKNLKKTKKVFKKAVGKLDIKEMTGDKQKDYTFELFGGEKIKLYKGQILSLYALYKRPQGRQHIESGGIVTDRIIYGEDGNKTGGPVQIAFNDIEKILNTLSEEEIKMVDDIVEFMTKECSAWGNDASLKLLGFEKYGENWYFPITVWDGSTNKEGRRKGDKKLTGQTFTKELVKDAGNAIVLGDFFDVALDHIVGMSLYDTVALPVLDMERVLNHTGDKSTVKQARTAIEKTYGKGTVNYIYDWMSEVNGDKKAVKADKFADVLFRNATKSKIAFKLSVLMKQFSSIARAGLEIDTGKLLKALKTIKNQKATIEEMQEHIPIAYYKSLGFRNPYASRDVKTAILDTEPLSDALAFGGYGKVDDFTWGVIFEAVKNEINQKIKNEKLEIEVGSKQYWEQVRERFNTVIDRTQVVDSVFHRSQIMRSNNTITKTATLYMAEPLTTLNAVRTQLQDGARNGEKGKAVGKSVAVLLTQALLSSLGHAFPKTLKDDEEEWYDENGKEISFGERFAKYYAEGFFNELNFAKMIPYLRDAIEIYEGWEQDDVVWADFAKVIKSAKNVIEGTDKPWYRDVIDLASAVTTLTGQPYGNALKEVEGWARTIMHIAGDEYVDYLITKSKLNVKLPSNKSKFMTFYERAMANGHADDAAIILEDYMAETFKGKDFNNKHTEAVTKEASKLLGKTDNDSKLIYSLPSEKFSLDGEETKIPDKDYPEFAEGYYNTLYDLAYEMVTDERYKNLSDEDKVRSFGDIESYAKATQLSEMFDGYDLTGWKEKVYDGETKFMDSVFERVADREFSDKKESYLDGLNFDESKYSEAELGIVEDVENKWAGYKASKDLGREIDESKYRHIIVYEDKLSDEMPLEEYAGVRAYAKKTAALYDLNDADESKGTEALTAKELEQYLDSTDYSRETKGALFMAIGNSNWYNKYTGLKNNGEPRKSSGGGGGSSGGKSFSRGNSKSSTKSSSGGSTRSTRTTRTTTRRSSR